MNNFQNAKLIKINEKIHFDVPNFFTLSPGEFAIEISRQQISHHQWEVAGFSTVFNCFTKEFNYHSRHASIRLTCYLFSQHKVVHLLCRPKDIEVIQ